MSLTQEEVDLILKKYETDPNYEHYRIEDELILDFFKSHYENNNLKDVLQKVCLLDSFYSTNLKQLCGIYEMSKHIVNSNIKIDGDPLVIEKIANFNGKNLYSFATKYCANHKPDSYVIYDNLASKMILEYNKVDNFYEKRLSRNSLKNQLELIKVVKKFIDFYKLKNNLRDIDRFLWIKGKEKQ